MFRFVHSKNLVRLFVRAAAGAALSAPSNAATATSTFPVSATVQATCNISAGALAFGTYVGAQVDSSSTI